MNGEHPGLERRAKCCRNCCPDLRAVLGGPHEIIMVDDGSSDGTPAVLRGESHEDRLTGVVLSRNFGHQAALSAELAQTFRRRGGLHGWGLAGSSGIDSAGS